jgi:hypothetical protein
MSTKMQVDDIRAAVGQLIQNKLQYMLTCFYIEDKQRNIVRLEPNIIQNHILRTIQPRGSRNIILKPSQVGASSIIIADYLADTLTRPGTTSVIVAYEEFITQRLLNKAQFFFDHIPDNLRPAQGHAAAHEKTFPDIHSTFYIGTARSAVFGRGEAIHNFLADEYAFWPDQARIMVPALQRVPLDGRINVLSTPNGEDNDFFELYDQAKSGQGNWKAHAFFWWLMHASQLTHPRLQVLYQLDGGNRAPEEDLSFEGYRGSRPVRIGNGAVDQRQLDIYGDLFQAVWLYVERGSEIDGETGGRLAETAGLVCDVWRERDRGLWEVRSKPVHFVQSKMMCWIALDRAIRLAEGGHLPREHVERWRKEAELLREFVEEQGFSEARGSYVRFAGSEELDASLLLGSLMGYCEGEDPRIVGTIDAIRRELGHGPYVRRYTGEDGLEGEEGAFLCCSFWLVEALARAGRADDAAELMESLLELGNDVGLYAEEIDPRTGEFLGNFPQGLTHIALVSAAVACERAARG